MKIVVIDGKRSASLRDVEDPRIAEDFVLVKIRVAPMCTEFHAYANGEFWPAFGHEAAGEVVAVAQPGKVNVGDRVVAMPQYPCGTCVLCLDGDYIHCESCVDPLQVCRSATGTATYAQYMVKQDWLLVPIPDGMSYEHASMACCGVGPSFGAMEKMNVNAFDTVLVAGLGPVGLGGVINGVYRNAAVIGCGYRSEMHLKAYQHLENARPAACCDLDIERARKRAGEFGLTAYESAEEMIAREKPDLVHVVTPPIRRRT